MTAALGVITAPTGVPVSRPEALFGRNPWVESLLFAQILKGVIVGRKLRAELLRLSGNKRMDDRIANGTCPIYEP